MVAFSNRTAIFKWCVVRWGCKNGHQKGIVYLKRHWTMYSKNVNHSIVNIIGGDPHNH